MHVHVCLPQACFPMSPYGDQSSALDGLFFIALHPISWVRVLLSWSSPLCLDSLPSKPLGSSCLCFSGTGVAHVCCHVRPSSGCCGYKDRPLWLCAHHLAHWIITVAKVNSHFMKESVNEWTLGDHHKTKPGIHKSKRQQGQTANVNDWSRPRIIWIPLGNQIGHFGSEPTERTVTCLLLRELVLPGLGVVGLGFGELKFPGTYEGEKMRKKGSRRTQSTKDGLAVTLQ